MIFLYKPVEPAMLQPLPVALFSLMEGIPGLGSNSNEKISTLTEEQHVQAKRGALRGWKE